MKSTSSPDAIKIVKTAGLILLDALIFHDTIAARSDPNVKTLSQILTCRSIKLCLEEQWKYIIEKVNYSPVFKIALKVLKSLPSGQNIEKILKELIRTAIMVASSRVILRHDLFGRIYHTLLLGNLIKSYATLYTSIPAARLLAALTLLVAKHNNKLDVSSVPPKYNNEYIKVCDFACGSGTLLSAIYKELSALHSLESGEPNLDDLHRYLLEEGLWGFDVLHHAAHLAATTLLFHNPQPVKRTRIYVLPFNENFIGSLEFLTKNNVNILTDLYGKVELPIRVSPSEKEVSKIEIGYFHIIIMNPPFTKAEFLLGELPKELRKKAQNRIKALLPSDFKEVYKAGMAAPFVVLAHKYLTKGGRMALVLPKTALSASSWSKIRELWIKNYHVEFIVSSFEAPRSWNFSENTDLSEILIVMKKLDEAVNKQINNRYTVFINLWRKPRNEFESVHIANLALNILKNPHIFDIENSSTIPYTIKLTGKTVGEIYTAILESPNNLAPYNFFAQAELNRMHLLLKRKLMYIPGAGMKPLNSVLIKLEEVADVGPDHKAFENVFRISNYDGRCYFKGFWGYDSSKIKEIIQYPNKCLIPSGSRKHRAKILWDLSSTLLVARRIRLNTYRLISIMINERVLSNVFWTIKLRVQDEAYSKLLALWFNSSLWFLMSIPESDITEGAWIEIKKSRLAKTLVPLPEILRNRELSSKVTEVFSLVRSKTWKPIPLEFEEPDARRLVDELILDILGVSEMKKYLDIVYTYLAKDPIVKLEPLS